MYSREYIFPIFFLFLSYFMSLHLPLWPPSAFPTFFFSLRIFSTFFLFQDVKGCWGKSRKTSQDNRTPGRDQILNLKYTKECQPITASIPRSGNTTQFSPGASIVYIQFSLSETYSILALSSAYTRHDSLFWLIPEDSRLSWPLTRKLAHMCG